MRIATWNIDGLKARRDELVRWLCKNQPDVMGLQETKTDDHEFLARHKPVFEAEGYRAAFHGEPSHNGIAILSKQHLEVTQSGLPGQECVGTRLLTAHTAGFSFTTVCVPSASGKCQPDIERKVARKLAWLGSLCKYLRERKNDDVPAILCGDFNITPEPIDAYHHWHPDSKEVKNRPGFRDDERSRLRSLKEAGWFDLVRELSPEGKLFSWWSPGNFYLQNKGLRLDLVFGNRAVVDRCRSCRIVHSPYEERGKTGKPDHAPVVVDLA